MNSSVQDKLKEDPRWDPARIIRAPHGTTRTCKSWQTEAAYSQHSGVMIVADGTDAAGKLLARVLVNDCGTGVMRHADAGNEAALECAKRYYLNLSMIEK